MSDKIQIFKIDTEKYPAIADKYKIQALPTFILFKDGEPFDRFVSNHTFSCWLNFLLVIITSYISYSSFNFQEGAMGVDKLVQRIEASLEAKQ